MNRALRAVIIVVVLVVVVTAGRHLFHRTTTTTTSTTTTSTTSPTTTPSSTTTSSPSSTTTTTTTTATSLTTCRGADFTGSNVGSEGAAGTGYDTMTLTRITPGSCVVDSYPIITLESNKGTVVTHYTSSDATNFPGAANGGAKMLTVSAGQKISLQLRYVDVPVGTEVCPSVSQVNVQFVANDTSVPVAFSFPISPCVGEGIAVSPFYPG